MAIDIKAIEDELKEQERQAGELLKRMQQLTDADFVEFAKEELWHIKHYSGMEFYIQTLENAIDIIAETTIKPKRAIFFAERGYNAKYCIDSGIVAVENDK